MMKLALFTISLGLLRFSAMRSKIVYDCVFSCLVFLEVESYVNSGAPSQSTEKSQADDRSHEYVPSRLCTSVKTYPNIYIYLVGSIQVLCDYPYHI